MGFSFSPFVEIWWWGESSWGGGAANTEKESVIFQLRVWEIVRILVQELVQEPISKNGFFAKFLLGNQSHNNNNVVLASV